MRLDQAVAYALHQQQVAALIALGCTNRQVAARLVITERTAAAHVEQIMNNLGFASRTYTNWSLGIGTQPEPTGCDLSGFDESPETA
jgi:hypothetical protein